MSQTEETKPEAAGGSGQEPLVSYRSMFDAEVKQAIAELRRPALALFLSGAVAGAAVGTAVPLLALIVAGLGGMPETMDSRLIFGGAYAAGFVLAILARTDLFTEYTTIAILPILTGASRFSRLARLWALVYLGNLVGGFAMAVAVAALGPALELFEHGDLAMLAHHLAAHPWWVVLLSAVMAGWLMGLLSWLIAGGRDTTSQILFIWLIGSVIGILGLHHAITGGVEMFAAGIADPSIGLSEVLHVLGWTSLGNAIGGAVFAVVIRQGLQMRSGVAGATKTDREQGRSRRGSG